MLTQQESRVQVKDYGTFKDSLRAPVHRWFQYPAGYSYKFIEAKAKEYRLAASSWVLDPFVGCGTTCVTLKQLGINSIGIEAHPFVYWVAKTKLYWEFDLSNLHADIERFWRSVLEGINHGQVSFADTKSLPPLVHKCFSQDNLSKLVFLRDTIERFASDEHTKDLLRLALTATLRLASRAGAGWPYIAPSRYHEKHEQEAFSTFYRLVGQMYQDLLYITARAVPQDTQCLLIQGDARDHHPTIPPSSIDLVITSPPYLNNYDYADRTRLEMYFFGWASSWRDITQNVRARLITAATTQITGNNAEQVRVLRPDIKHIAPLVYADLNERVQQLARIRVTKGGKKRYDLMIIGYFNDMFLVLRRIYDVLKPGHDFVLVLGDSAPYGVHIPTEIYLGELAKGLGYSSYKVELLRTRGDKWAHNPQRHKVPLKECVLTITK